MAKKPSPVANLVLLLVVLVPVIGLGFLGWWGYKKFMAPKPGPEVVVPAKEPAKPEPVPEPVAPVTPEPVKPAPEPVAPVTPVPVPEPVALVTPPPAPEPVAPVTPVPEPVAPVTPPPVPEPVAPVTPMPEPVKPEPVPEPVPVVPVAPVEAAPVGSVASRTFTVFPTDSAEGKALLEDAERRIQEAPKEVYSEQKKLLVRRGLRSAKSLARVTTVFFGTGQTGLNAAGTKALGDGMNSEEVKNILKDPKAVVFVLGFSDPTGLAQVNQTLAKARAESVKKFLGDNKLSRGEIHSIAIGSTEVISGANKEKNRAAEVWIVMQ